MRSKLFRIKNNNYNLLIELPNDDVIGITYSGYIQINEKVNIQQKINNYQKYIKQQFYKKLSYLYYEKDLLICDLKTSQNMLNKNDIAYFSIDITLFLKQKIDNKQIINDITNINIINKDFKLEKKKCKLLTK